VTVPVARPVPVPVATPVVRNVAVPVLVGTQTNVIPAEPVHHDSLNPKSVPYAPAGGQTGAVYVNGVSPSRNQENPFPSLYVQGTGIAGVNGAAPQVGAYAGGAYAPAAVPAYPSGRR